MAESRGRAYGLMIFLAFLLLGNMQIADCLTRKGRVIAMDLGATSSCVGVYKNSGVKIIANKQGNRITPSLVAFTDNETLIGEAAKNQTASNPERTIFDVKRLIGRKFDDEEVQRAIKHVPYKIVNKEGKPYIEVKIKDGKTKLFSPEEISAMILHKMKESAEAFLGEKIIDAVITVPAYFNDAQRQSTKDAGVMAGLNVTSIIDEPTAAAFPYHFDTKKVLVFTLGGRTFDASILKIDDKAVQVLSTSGDSHLGGEDFDQRITEYLIKLIKNNYGKDISKKADAVGKLRILAERAKRALSRQHQVRIEIESFFGVVDFSESLSRSRFEQLNNDLFEKTLAHVEKAIKDAGLENKKEIDEIVLVGGSSRIPKVQQLLKDYFDGKEPHKPETMNPDEAVAYGAAIQGDIQILNQGQDRNKEQDLNKKKFWVELPPLAFFDLPPDKERFISQEEAEQSELRFREVEEWIEDLDKDREDRIDALNRLETYVKKLINDKDEKVKAAAKEALKWLDENPGYLEKEVYEEKLKDVEAVCNPVVIRLMP